MKIFMSLIITSLTLSDCVFATRTCFNPKKIIDSLLQGRETLHYNKKDYNIDQSSLDQEKRITQGKESTLVLKEGIRTETKDPESKRIEIKCVYDIEGTDKRIIVTRTHRTCFRVQKIIDALSRGEDVFKFNKKDYQMDQSKILDPEDKIEQDKPITIRLSSGQRDEVVTQDGKHKVVCTYPVTKNERHKEKAGVITVTRTIDPQ